MDSGLFSQKFGRSWIVALVGFWVAIALTGCNPNQFKTAAAQIPHLVIATTANPKTFNYALTQESPNKYLCINIYIFFKATEIAVLLPC